MSDVKKLNRNQTCGRKGHRVSEDDRISRVKRKKEGEGTSCMLTRNNPYLGGMINGKEPAV